MSPIPITIRYKRGPEGVGQVRVLPKLIVIKDNETGMTYEIARDKVGSGVVLVAGENLYYQLSGRKDTLWRLRPTSRKDYVRYVGMIHEKEKPPIPKLEEGGSRTRKDKDPETGQERTRSWVEDDRLVWTALFEIQVGTYAGMIVSRKFDYCFSPSADGSVTGIDGEGARAKRVKGLLDVAGMDMKKDSLPPWPLDGNILPELHEMLLERAPKNPIFVGLNQFGYITEMTVPDPSIAPAGLFKKKAAKKAAKKSAKKAVRRRSR